MVSTHILPASEGGKTFSFRNSNRKQRECLPKYTGLRKKNILGNCHLSIAPLFHNRGFAPPTSYQSDFAIIFPQSQNNELFSCSDSTTDIDNRIPENSPKVLLGIGVNTIQSFRCYIQHHTLGQRLSKHFTQIYIMVFKSLSEWHINFLKSSCHPIPPRWVHWSD
jgi:hypothetical protein